ncbi:N-acetyltransferase family protein [Neobacillus sp. Marseille-QA0830]
MLIGQQEFNIKGLTYIIRSAGKSDAESLSELRLQIDGETENMDREKGEAFIGQAEFEKMIENDTNHSRHLCLVAEVDGRLVGYSRCEGSDLKRFSHKVEFGLGVLKDYWSYGIGRNLMQQSIAWADANSIKKIVLMVLETNLKAIELYKTLGFEMEGLMKHDRILSDGNYYSTYVMGRIIE